MVKSSEGFGVYTLHLPPSEPPTSTPNKFPCIPSLRPLLADCSSTRLFCIHQSLSRIRCISFHLQHLPASLTFHQLLCRFARTVRILFSKSIRLAYSAQPRLERIGSHFVRRCQSNMSGFTARYVGTHPNCPCPFMSTSLVHVPFHLRYL